MKSVKTLTMIMALSLILISQHCFAQTAEELLPKAIQLEEVKGDLDNAIKTYQLILDKYPDNREVCAEAILHLGICYEKLGLDLARQTYRDVISKYSEQSDKVAMARKRISALDAYNAELLAKAEQHFKRGNELFKRWEYEAAIQEYENAVKSGPNTQLALNARYCIGQSWYRAGEYETALATFMKLIEDNPKSNIAPVTELMVAQVKHAIENKKSQATANNHPDENTIVDPETGITYRKFKSFTGESDIITYTTDLNLSPNGKFLLTGNSVVPMDGTAPFELIDFNSTGIQVTRGTWSPDGTKAAFYSGDALCVVPVSPETGRTTGPYKKIKEDNLKYEPNPSWSPDSKKITYNDGDKAELCIISADGNDFKQITDNELLELGPVWSPDGKNIAYGFQDRSIGLYNIENGQFSEIAKTGTRTFPKWSPDGKWILDGYWRNVFLFNLANSSEYKFSPPKEVGGFFSWQEDSDKWLFFRSSYYANSCLKIASPGGGPSFEPVPLMVDYWHLWSSDSKLIAVWGENEKGDLVIRLVPLSGGKDDAIHLDDLPDGKPKPFEINSKLSKLLFSIELGNGEKDLYVVPISTEEAKTTGPPVKFCSNYRGRIISTLSPDGEELAYIYEGNIWIAYTNGDDPIRITDFQEEVNLHRWTTDGKSLLFSTPSGWRLMENPGPQCKIIELLDEGKEIECRRFNIDISPDNSRVAVLTDQKIKIIPLDGTKSGKVLDISDLVLKGCGELCWSPDGKSLAFIGAKEVDDKVSFPNGKFCIYNVPVNGSPPVRVAPDDDDVKYFLSWSPDGKWLAFSPEKTIKIRPESTIWEADFKDIVDKLRK